MQGPVQARRRWFGMLFLILAGGMLLWGLLVLEPRLAGLGFVFYWSACFLFTLLALVVGWLDLRAVRFEQRRQMRELMKRTLSETEAAKRAERTKTAANAPSDRTR